MSIKEKAINALEFNKIREILASVSPTSGAAQKALELSPDTRKEIIIKNQKKTTDARRLLEAKGMPPFGSVVYAEGICDRASKGAVLTLQSKLAVLPYLGNIKDRDGVNRYFPC